MCTLDEVHIALTEFKLYMDLTIRKCECPCLITVLNIVPCVCLTWHSVHTLSYFDCWQLCRFSVHIIVIDLNPKQWVSLEICVRRKKIFPLGKSALHWKPSLHAWRHLYKLLLLLLLVLMLMLLLVFPAQPRITTMLYY